MTSTNVLSDIFSRERRIAVMSFAEAVSQRTTSNTVDPWRRGELGTDRLGSETGNIDRVDRVAEQIGGVDQRPEERLTGEDLPPDAEAWSAAAGKHESTG